MTISETPSRPKPARRRGAMPPAPEGHLLQRVILPRTGDPMSVRALYLDERTGIRLTTVPDVAGRAEPPKRVSLAGSGVSVRRLRATSRTSAVVPEQSEVSFGAYFNAFA